MFSGKGFGKGKSLREKGDEKWIKKLSAFFGEA